MPLAKRIFVIVLVLGLKMFAQNEARWEYRQSDALQGKTSTSLFSTALTSSRRRQAPAKHRAL